MIFNAVRQMASFGVVAALTCHAGKAAAGQPAPTAPPADARWVVDESGLTCAMARPIAAGPVTLIVQTYPGSGSYDLALVAPQWRERARTYAQSATLTLTPGGPVYDHRAMMHDLPGGQGRRMQFLNLPADFLEGFGQATAVRVTYRTRDMGTFQLPQAGAVSRVFADCEANKLVEWGADPAGFGPGTRRPQPIGDADQWVSAADLPDLVEQPQRVAAAARLSLDAAGRPDQCSLIDPSGMAQLDPIICPLLTSRARYEPARDRSGNPVRTVAVYRVNWVAFLRWDISPD